MLVYFLHSLIGSEVGREAYIGIAGFMGQNVQTAFAPLAARRRLSSRGREVLIVRAHCVLRDLTLALPRDSGAQSVAFPAGVVPPPPGDARQLGGVSPAAACACDVVGYRFEESA